MPGPDPSSQQAGSVVPRSPIRESLFLPGTDDEGESVVQGLVADPPNDDEVEGTEGEDGNGGADDEADSDGDSSPIPTKARRLQKPRIQFVFDDVTGDFDPHPTIFLPRLAAPPPQGSQGTKSDATKTKKRKDAKGNDKKAGTAVTRKRSRDDDDGAPTVDKSASKKLKSNNPKVANDKGVKLSGLFVLQLIFFI